MASTMATDRSDCCTRIFRPFASASVLIGLLRVYIERAPLSYQARPTKPAPSHERRIWSPISLSSTLCKCSLERNRKGREGTRVVWQMLCIAALETRAMARAPSFTCSIESSSLPSEPPAYTFRVMRPLVRCLTSSPNWRTA
ncbi:hypothetical protein D3C72_1784350 [compost metagenome]